MIGAGEEVEGGREDLGLLRGVAWLAEGGAHGCVDGKDARRAGLLRDRGEAGDDHGRDPSEFDESLQSHGRAMAGASTAGEDHGVGVHGVQLVEQLRCRHGPQRFEVATATVEPDVGRRHRAHHAAVNKAAKAIDGHHHVRVVLDVCMVVAADPERDLRDGRVGGNLAEGVVACTTERPIAEDVRSGGTDERDRGLADRDSELGEYRWLKCVDGDL